MPNRFVLSFIKHTVRLLTTFPATLWSQLEKAVLGFSITKPMADEIAAKVNHLNREDVERSKQQYLENKTRLESLIQKNDQLYEDFTKALIDEEDFRRLKIKTREEIQILKQKMENDYQKVQEIVRERLLFTLELAKDAELNWKKATPSDRVVLLKYVLSNFLLEGLNVRYDLKKPYAILSQIKTSGPIQSWCARARSRRTALGDEVCFI